METEDQMQRCGLGSCANGGVCLQEWNRFICLCHLTSFTGPTCSDGIFLLFSVFKHAPKPYLFTFDSNFSSVSMLINSCLF